jgi:hypothetical protein
MPYNKQVAVWMIPVVCGLAQAGMPLSAIAGRIKVSKRTLMRWLEEGRADDCTDQLLAELAQQFDEERALAIEQGVQTLKVHGTGDWRAQMEYLKMLSRDEFEATSTKTVNVNLNPQRPLDLSGATDEELAALEAAEQVKARLSDPRRRVLTSGE